MNGTATPEERLARKRALESELAVIREQKGLILREISQIAKKQKLGGPPTQAVQMTHAGKVEAEHRFNREELAKIWSACSKIMAELLKHQNTKTYFGEPVRRDLYPGYYDVIKQPRDLGTIKRNVEQGVYATPLEFRDDIRLCFENCRNYNPPGHIVRKMGDYASDKFEQKWAARAMEAQYDGALRRHQVAMERLDAEAKSLPDKIREMDEELQELAAKAAAREAPPPPGPGRPMTFEEKRKLSHSLGLMPGERLERVLEIIADGPSAPQIDAEEEECALEIDSLDDDTLWKLQAYVDAVLVDVETKAARPPPAVPASGPAPAAAAAGAAAGAAASAGAGGAEGSESEEGVGSKGNDSGIDDTAPTQKAPAGQDLTTFVSATGPQGGQPQILRNTAQKKDIQLQNVGDWATLKESQDTPAAGAAAASAEAAAAAGGDDDLWTEFQGRATQEEAAAEQKAALEEEERRAKAAAAAAAEAEAARLKAEAEEEAQRAEREAAERRQREAAELARLTDRGAEEAGVEMLRQAGHQSGVDLDELGLAPREEEHEDEAMEEI